MQQAQTSSAKAAGSVRLPASGAAGYKTRVQNPEEHATGTNSGRKDKKLDKTRAP